MPLGRFWGYAFSALLGGLTAAASIVAILGYHGPASFPIVRGIEITVCDQIDEADIGDQERFLGELKKHNRQVVFISSLIVYGACWNGGAKYKPTEKMRQKLSNDYFEYVDNDLNERGGVISGGTVTVGFKKLYRGDPGVWLVIGAPQKEHYFSDANCGENCFGAHGLYKLSVSFAEGYTVYRADPFPATSGIMDAYQCTIDRMAAKTRWERFAACRF